jgi:tetratricopeptide (TPR) repeat protein
VELEDRNGEVKKIPIDKIREVQFGGEPTSLRSARGFLLRGRGGDAVEELAKVENSQLDGAEPLVLAEMQFVKAAGTGRVALETGEKIDEAVTLLTGFLSKNAKSHHAYDVQELLGDLLARAGKADEAKAAYSVVAKGPPALQVRAATAKARLSRDAKKYAEAIKEYDIALGIKADDDASEAQKRSATLEKARVLSLDGKPAEGMALVQQTITQANPEAKDLLARAYAAEGAIYRLMGDKDQDALISFLTVDLVYNTVPEVHAEALYNLVELWEKGKQLERSRTARENLGQSYPSSPWAKKLESSEKPS